MVPLKIVSNVSRCKPALDLNRVVADLNRGSNSLNSISDHWFFTSLDSKIAWSFCFLVSRFISYFISKFELTFKSDCEYKIFHFVVRYLHFKLVNCVSCMYVLCILESNSLKASILIWIISFFTSCLTLLSSYPCSRNSFNSLNLTKLIDQPGAPEHNPNLTHPAYKPVSLGHAAYMSQSSSQLQVRGNNSSGPELYFSPGTRLDWMLDPVPVSPVLTTVQSTLLVLTFVFHLYVYVIAHRHVR